MARNSLTGLKLLLCVDVVFAQQFPFENFSVEDGLAQSQVTCVMQDRDGFLWLGTYGGGLSRFDGVRFETFTVKDGLAGNAVYALAKDAEGALWAAAANGVNRFEDGGFKALALAPELSRHNIRAIMFDRRNQLWVGSDGGGVGRFDGEAWTLFTESDGLSGKTTRVIFEDRDGGVWIGTNEQGLFRYDGRRFAPMDVAAGLENSSIFTVFQDSAGVVWVGSHDGLSRYDGASWRTYGLEGLLADNTVRAMVEDRDGRLWLGTDSGLVRWDGRDFTLFPQKEGQSCDPIWSMALDRGGSLWLGTYRGGVYRFGGEQFALYTTQTGLSDDIIRTIAEDRRGNLWLGTYRGGLTRIGPKGGVAHFTTRDGLPHNFVLCQFEDRDGVLWFGTYGGVSRYDGSSFVNLAAEDGLGDNVIRAIAQDNEGALWFATNRGGVGIYDGSDLTRLSKKDGLTGDRVMTLAKGADGLMWIGGEDGVNWHDGQKVRPFAGPSKASRKNIYTIAVDANDGLWFAVYGGGVVYFDSTGLTEAQLERPPPESFAFINSDNGLLSDQVVSLVFDAHGDLWIGTEGGVSRLDAAAFHRDGSVKVRSYGRKEGFIGIECIHNAAGRDRQGRLWFGTLKGAARYDPAAGRLTATPPNIHITDLRLFQESVDRNLFRQGLAPSSNLAFDYRQNHLTFGYTGLDFNAPRQVRYRYQLDNFDEDWLPVTRERHATYANLPPGRYTFRVMAANGEGVWSEMPATYRFQIIPPFWRTWWFRGVAIILAIATLAAAYRLKARGMRAWNKRLQLMVRDRTGELERSLVDQAATNALLKREITAHQQAQTELKVAKEAAEAANRSKSAFLANMSHEIRTPMNAVIGMTDLVLGSRLDDEQRQFLEIVRANSKVLLHLLDDILDFSKIEADKLDIECIAFDLWEAVEDVVETIAVPAESKGLALFNHIDPAVPRRVMGDPKRLYQVLINLLGNALKFTDEGSIQLRATLLEKPNRQRARLRFSVTDTGMGVSKEKQRAIFDKFSQEDSSTTRKWGGTGLGLSIAKSLVELMGGAIGLESAKGRGSEFFFELTMDLASDRPAPAPPTASGPALVVNPHDEDRAYWAALLRFHGFAVETVADEREARALLEPESERFDLAAIAFPHGGSRQDIDVLNRLLRNCGPHAPKTILAIPINDRFNPRFKEAGADALISLPLRLSRFAKTLARLLSGPSEASAHADNDQTETRDAALEARVLAVDDSRTNLLLTQKILAGAGCQVDLAETGATGVAAAIAGEYDVILMDIQMPEMDGFEAAGQIRAHESRKRQRHVPIIALTAHAFTGYRARCLKHGMNDYLTKPVNKQALLQCVRRWVAPRAETPAG